jgi:ABC-type Fe3+-hydroxamate transport system substrate-binding protein
MRRILPILLLAMLAAGCGQAASTSSSPKSTSTADRISGVYLVHPSSQKGGGQPVAGVVVALYRRAVRTGGPILADPPLPIARTRTDAHGRFVFPPMPGKRYFVAPVGPSVATPGRWAHPGTRVVLEGCSNCLIPM